MKCLKIKRFNGSSHKEKKELSLLKTGKSKAEVEIYYEIICCMLKNVYLYSRNWFSPSQGQLKGWLSSSERLKGNRV